MLIILITFNPKMLFKGFRYYVQYVETKYHEKSELMLLHIFKIIRIRNNIIISLNLI